MTLQKNGMHTWNNRRFPECVGSSRTKSLPLHNQWCGTSGCFDRLSTSVITLVGMNSRPWCWCRRKTVEYWSVESSDETRSSNPLVKKSVDVRNFLYRFRRFMGSDLNSALSTPFSVSIPMNVLYLSFSLASFSSSSYKRWKWKFKWHCHQFWTLQV